MILMTCGGCGREGRVPGRLAGLRVYCKLCGEPNDVPDSDTLEVYVGHWLAAIDPATVSVTVEVDTLGWSCANA